MLGCAIPIAVLFFVFGMLFSFAIPEGLSLLGRLGIATMIGGVTFFVVILLCLRDRTKFFSTKKRVHQRLMARHDVSDDDFCLAFHLDRSILLDVRQALALFFTVPPTKIHPTDQLAVFEYNSFEPNLHLFIISHILNKRRRTISSFTFPEHPNSRIEDLAREISVIVEASHPI